jgi:hypothetical protein
MTDDRDDSAIDGFNRAKEAVESTTVKVDDVGRHLGAALKRASRPESPVEALEGDEDRADRWRAIQNKTANSCVIEIAV